jgi:hypothetical protein
MSGFITKTEVIENRKMIISSWGEDFYSACLLAEGQTFLSLLVKMGKL